MEDADRKGLAYLLGTMQGVINGLEHLLAVEIDEEVTHPLKSSLRRAKSTFDAMEGAFESSTFELPRAERRAALAWINQIGEQPAQSEVDEAIRSIQTPIQTSTQNPNETSTQ